MILFHDDDLLEVSQDILSNLFYRNWWSQNTSNIEYSLLQSIPDLVNTVLEGQGKPPISFQRHAVAKLTNSYNPFAPPATVHPQNVGTPPTGTVVGEGSVNLGNCRNT